MYKEPIRQVTVSNFERLTEPALHYVYVIDVEWNDSSKCVIKRTYKQFFKFHIDLIEMFPCEDQKKRILPYLPGKSLFGETFFNAKNRSNEIAQYCEKILQLPEHMSTHKLVLEFFRPTEAEIASKETIKTEKVTNKKRLLFKPIKPKRKAKTEVDSVVEVTGPMKVENYVAIAKYKSETKDQLNLEVDEIVDVVQKDSNGWWLICNAYNNSGWVPGGFLQRTNSRKVKMQQDQIDAYNAEREKLKTNTNDKMKSIMANYEAIDDYTAIGDLELSFAAGDVITITQQSKQGWWFGNFNGRSGWVPGNYFESQPTNKLLINKTTTPSKEDDNNYCIVTYDYTAKREEEINVNKNEKVKIIDGSDEKLWLIESWGMRGWVPSNCLKMLPVESIESPTLLKTANHEKRIDDEVWFKKFNRKEAEEFLTKNAQNNSFVIRPSRAGGNRNPYSVTVYHQAEIIHFHIRQRLDGNFATGIYSVEEKKFKSVQDMVEFYKSHTLVIDGKNIMLKNYCSYLETY